jgi:hypothetical protein
MDSLPLRLLCCGALLIGAANAHAVGAVYKWTDANGVTHYDDRSVVRGELITREYMNQRQIDAAPDWTGTIPSDVVDEVKARCDAASSRLDDYRAAPRLYGRDPDGNVYRLSSRQSALLIEQTQREVRRYCAPDAVQQNYANRK